jgi:hypothetical protein
MTLKQTANIAIYGVFVAEPAHDPFLLPTNGALNIHAPRSLLLSAATASCAELVIAMYCLFIDVKNYGLLHL